MARYKNEWVEWFFKQLGFELVHDGSQNITQHELPERKFFTRKYRLKMNGQWADAYVKFIYDRRKGECIDFKITGKDAEGIKREQLVRMQT